MLCVRAVHTLLFLDPGHFHAALALRVPNPRVADEIFVYAPDGAERRDFLALVERFNRRAEAPTRWRPVAISDGDPLARLIGERRGDVVVLAGRNGGKARTIRRLHEAGFHVLADKPWLVDPGDLADLRASLGARPLVMEMMTGRHDATARLMKRLVDTDGVFGAFAADGPAIEFESVHHLEKLVDSAPLRRPWWFFDVRVQGSGAVDIPTHLVDQTQWLVDGAAHASDGPCDSSRYGAGRRACPPGLPSNHGRACVPRGAGTFHGWGRARLSLQCRDELSDRGVTARRGRGGSWRRHRKEETRIAPWRGAPGRRDARQGPETGGRRRLFVEPRGEIEPLLQALARRSPARRPSCPAWVIERHGRDRSLIVIPPALSPVTRRTSRSCWMGCSGQSTTAGGLPRSPRARWRSTHSSPRRPPRCLRIPPRDQAVATASRVWCHAGASRLQQHGPHTRARSRRRRAGPMGRRAVAPHSDQPDHHEAAASFVEMVKTALAPGDCQGAAKTMQRATEALSARDAPGGERSADGDRALLPGPSVTPMRVP